jgi:hypothetical protein
MDETGWYTAEDAAFTVRIPAGWQAEPNAEDGGVDIWNPEGPGELHLTSFPVPPGEQPDPGEELFAFLAESEVELEEDEVEDVVLEGGAELALCEFLSEDEESGEIDYSLMGVAVFADRMVFAHYTCAYGDEERERERVRSLLQTLRDPAAN